MNHAEQVDDEANGLATRRRDVMNEARPVCAACRSRVGVRLDAKLPGVWFCDECWQRAKEHDDAELGVAD